MPSQPAKISACACALLCLSASVALAEDAGWQKIHEEQGISVSTREGGADALPTFRGQAQVKAPVLHILAVLLDDEHSGEWAKGADESNVLRSIDERTQVIYARAHQRWPVQDRDVVMRRSVDVLKPGELYRVKLVCVPGEKPSVDGVVRVRRCENSFLLHAIDAERTMIDYRVHADPGGDNPDWIVRMASKNIPLDTLSGLRRQVVRTRGKYDATVAQWAKAR
jgi:hypothetical protein